MSLSRVVVVFLTLFLPGTAALGQRSASARVGPIANVDASRRQQIAPHAFGWQAGPLQNTYGPDCLDLNGGWLYGFIVTGWVAYYGDPAASPPYPRAGDVYYTYVFAQNSATCTSAAVQPFLILPANTTLAISAANPVYCFRNGSPYAGAPCSQSPALSTSLSGATGYNLGLWTNLNGGSVEIQVPVTSTTDGIKTLAARIDTAGGGNGWITPSVSYLTGFNAPTVSYPVSPTTSITNTTARTTADVFNQYQAGTFYFDIGTTTSYGTSTAGNAVSSAGNGFQYFTDWSGLTPGTLYHWRGRFTYAGGTIVGADQTFTTAGTAGVPPVPTYVDAVPLSATQVKVTWEGDASATSYEISRRGPNVASTFAPIGTSSVTSFTDVNATAASSYQYRVRAMNGSGYSAYSQADLTTTVLYSDDRLVEFVTPIRANHLIELRTAVNSLRTLAGLGAGVYTDAAVPGLKIKAAHILEARTQYDQAMGVITGFNSSWATTPVVGGPVTFVDVQQLRDRLK